MILNLRMEGMAQPEHDPSRSVVTGTLRPEAFERVLALRLVRDITRVPRVPRAHPPLDVSDINELLRQARDR